MKRGCISKRGPSSWQIKLDKGTVNGRRHCHYATVRGTYKDAQRELTRLLAALDGGTLPDVTRATLGEYVNAWFETAHEQSPKTLERYRQLAAKQIVLHLGSIPLQKLRPEDVQRWHGTLLKSDKLAPRTITHAHRLLSLILQCGVRNGALARNVAAVHNPPAVEQDEIKIIAPEQIGEVLRALEDHPLYPAVALTLASGLRRSELLALQWGDVDLDRGTMRIERSLEETRKGGIRVKPPKTKRGKRTITLPSETIAVLRAHKVKQLETRLALGLGNIVPDTPIFGTLEGALQSPNNFTRAWSRVCRAKGLPMVNFHSLRHAHASALIRAGVDVLTVSRRLGHSKSSITLDVYGHLVEGADAAAAKAIGEVLR